jgi:hypothetical protein
MLKDLYTVKYISQNQQKGMGMQPLCLTYAQVNQLVEEFCMKKPEFSQPMKEHLCPETVQQYIVQLASKVEDKSTKDADKWAQNVHQNVKQIGTIGLSKLTRARVASVVAKKVEELLQDEIASNTKLTPTPGHTVQEV